MPSAELAELDRLDQVEELPRNGPILLRLNMAEADWQGCQSCLRQSIGR
jgi:hypothetical protein